MADTLENEMCDRLVEVLEPIKIGEPIAESAEFSFVLEALERYVSHVIREVHLEFGGALDGFESVEVRKRGEWEMELWGATFVISNEPDIVTPLHLRIQVNPQLREVSWMECRLGIRQNERLVGLSSGRLSSFMDRIEDERDARDLLPWAYEVGFGERYP